MNEEVDKSLIMEEVGNKINKEAIALEIKSKIPPFVKQLFVVAGICLQKVGLGASLGYTAILLSSLMEPDSEIYLSDEIASWILATFPVGNFVASFLSPLIMKKYGRKAAQQISGVVLAISWISMGTARNNVIIIISKVLQGLANGFQMVVLSVFISETTSPKHRGFFLATISLSISFGKFLAHLMGTYFSWRTTAFLCSIFSIFSVVIVTLSPETPNWLASKGSYEKAKKSFIWLRGSGDRSREEMEIFIVHKKQDKKRFENGDKNIIQRTIELLKRKDIYKAIVTSTLLFVAYVSSTSEFLAMYVINILQKVLDNKSDSYIIMNTMDVVRIASSIVAILIIKMFNRRTVFFTSGILTVLSMIMFASYIYLTTSSYVKPSFYGVNIVINILVFSMSIGILPLPFVYAGELFPLSDKEFGGFATSVVSCISLFIMLKSSIFLLKYLNVYGLYFLCSGVFSVSLLILYFLLPETKGKTLVEIET